MPTTRSLRAARLKRRRNRGQDPGAGQERGWFGKGVAVGLPGREVDGYEDVGAAIVLYGALFADGLEWGITLFWSATSP